MEEVTDLGILQKIQKEDGFVAYQYYYDATDANTLLLVEEWESEAKQQAHLQLIAISKSGRTTSSERKICLTDLGSQDLSIMQGMLTRHF